MRHRRPTAIWAGGVAAAAALVLVSGCTSAPTTPAGPGSASPGTASSGSESASTAANALTVNITIANGQVDPSGEKLTATVGQQVVLNVTTDEADEIHAHTGGDGYELEVPAGKTTTGRFTVDQPGSFEVESHHLEKIIVILNVS